MGIFHLTINQAQRHTLTQPKMTNVQETFKNTNLIKQDGSEVSGAVLKDKKVLVYFSAHWCPPCRGFTPVLKEKWENQLKAADVQVVFVSSDRDDASATSYFNNDHGDYFMAPHGCEAYEFEKRFRSSWNSHLSIFQRRWKFEHQRRPKYCCQ